MHNKLEFSTCLTRRDAEYSTVYTLCYLHGCQVVLESMWVRFAYIRIIGLEKHDTQSSHVPRVNQLFSGAVPVKLTLFPCAPMILHYANLRLVFSHLSIVG